MKKIFIFICVALMVVGLAGCGSSGKAPKLVVDGAISFGQDYGSPYYYGTVKNIGEASAYLASIDFTIYEDGSKTKIIGTAWDSLANGAEIKPGQSTDFKAVAFGLESTTQLTYYTYKISYFTIK